jgi:hypothetical protein
MRLNQLPDQQLFQQLRQLDRDITDLRQRQRTSGRSGVIGYTSDSGNQWDSTGTITALDHALVFQIDYVGDGSQDYPIVMPRIDMFVLGSAEANRLPAYRMLISGNNVAQFNYLDPDLSLAADALRLRWTYSVEVFGFDGVHSATVDWHLKAWCAGSSPGAVTVTRTA